MPNAKPKIISRTMPFPEKSFLPKQLSSFMSLYVSPLFYLMINLGNISWPKRSQASSKRLLPVQLLHFQSYHSIGSVGKREST